MKILSTETKKDSISVYISVNNPLLSNELKNICENKNLSVINRKDKAKSCDYVISSSENIEKLNFTNSTKAILVTSNIKFIKNTNKIEKKGYNKIIFHDSSLVRPAGINIFASKIVNELLKKNSHFQVVNLSKKNFIKRWVPLKKLLTYFLFIVFILFFLNPIYLLFSPTPKTNELPINKNKCSMHNRVYNMGSLPIRTALLIFPNASFLQDFKNIIDLKALNFKIACTVSSENTKLVNFVRCLISKCDNNGFLNNQINTLEKPLKNKISLRNFQKKYNEQYDQNLILFNVYLEQNTLIEIFNKLFFSDSVKNILLVKQNPQIPTQNGGVVEKILLYKIAHGSVAEENVIEIEDISLITKNNFRFLEYQKFYPFTKDSTSINFFDGSIQQLSNIVSTTSNADIDFAIFINNDISKALLHEKLNILSFLEQQINDKNILINSKNDNINNLFKKLTTSEDDIICGKDAVSIVENSFAGFEMDTGRIVNFDQEITKSKILNKVDYFLPVPAEQLNLEINITVIIPSDAQNVDFNQKVIKSYENSGFKFYDISYSGIKSDNLIFSYMRDIFKSSCNSSYDFVFRTQPGLSYDIDYQLKSELVTPLEDEALTEKGVGIYNTSLFGQKADIVFSYFLK